MRASNVLTPLFFAATTLAQGPPEGIAPSSAPPTDCQTNANGNFTIGTLKVAHQHKRESAMDAADGALICNLHNGILRDANGRTGSVVANQQFQFDGPPQAGAIYTGGFSICKNGSLAIGGTTQWWQCSSGPFYNLYDTNIGAQCEEIRIQVTFPQSATPSSSSAVAASSTSSSMTVASVMSSLITITGAVSTVSASAVGPSASFSGNATMASVTSSHTGSATDSSATGSATKGLTPGSSASAGATSAAAAPPAGGAAASIDVAKATSFVALMAFVGAALII